MGFSLPICGYFPSKDGRTLLMLFNCQPIVLDIVTLFVWKHLLGVLILPALFGSFVGGL